MGRAGRKQKSVVSLREGKDSEGKVVRQGEKDSTGRTVGFIDQDGTCYEDLQERDIVVSEKKIEEALLDWKERKLAEPVPRISQIVIEHSLGKVTPALLREIADSFRYSAPGSDIKNLFWLASAAHNTSSPREKECALAAFAFAAEMRRCSLGGRPEGRPSALEISKRVCADQSTSERAAKIAEAAWHMVSDLGERSNWREDEVSLYQPRYPLFAERSSILYPSRIEGAEIALDRISETAAEKEAARKKLEELSRRLEQEGLGALPEALIDRITRMDLDAPSFSGGDLPVEKIESRQRPIWQAQWRLRLNEYGDSLSVDTSREGVDEARRAGWKLEEAVLAGPLIEEEITLKIIGRSQSPEEAKRQALQILSEGKEGDHMRRMRALGVPEERILRDAESIAMGSREERAFLLAQAEIFLPDLGQVCVSISAEHKDVALQYVRELLPGARFREE